MVFRPAATDEEVREVMEENLTSPEVTPMAEGEALSPEEVAEIERQYSLSQPIKIPNEKLDPNYTYRWISKDVGNLRKRKAKGWVLVTNARLAELCRKGITVDELHMGTHVGADDLVSVNKDMALGCLPMRHAKAYQQHFLARSQAREGGASRNFHATGRLVEEAGYPVDTYDKR